MPNLKDDWLRMQVETAFVFSFPMSPGNVAGHVALFEAVNYFLKSKKRYPLMEAEVMELARVTPKIGEPKWHPNVDFKEFALGKWGGWMRELFEKPAELLVVHSTTDRMIDLVSVRDRISFESRVNGENGKAPYLHTMRDLVAKSAYPKNDFFNWYGPFMMERFEFCRKFGSSRVKIKELDELYERWTSSGTRKRVGFLR